MDAGECGIPVCVLVTTKNEEANIARCLDSVRGFSYVAVIDSYSNDRTCVIAREMGANLISYQWDGTYPKKRQWCVDAVDLPYDWVLWLDADEELTPGIINEIRCLFRDGAPNRCGYFIRGQYVIDGVVLKYGLRNNKIALMDRRKMAFPVIDDLDIEGMGEIEGHYQPVLKDGVSGKVGQVMSPLYHYAYDDSQAWIARHERYARWEAGMNLRNSWPRDPIWWREKGKWVIRRSVFRPYIVFLYAYVFRCGFLDGRAGLLMAKSRFDYCRMILQK